jgi:hypothetical protein
MRFISRNKDEVVRIASTSGHIVLVGGEFTEVPEHMERDAYALGCVSEELYNSIKSDMEKDAAAAKNSLLGGGNPPGSADRSPVVIATIKTMLESSEDGYFTKAGLPNLKVLEKLCGFTVSKDDMETAWGVVSAETSLPGGE